MSLRIAFVIMLAWLFSTELASAQSCGFTMTDINFGSVNLSVGGIASTSGTFTAICTGTPGSTITICPNIGDGTSGSNSGNPRLMGNGPRSIPFNLYQPSGQIWGSYVWPYAPLPPTLSLTLNGSGNGSLTHNMNAQITGTLALAPAGVYQSVYNGPHTLIDYGYAPAHNCKVVSTRAARAPFTVSAINNNSCNISATPMSFGTRTDLNSAQIASNQISITCTNGVKYNVGLSNGSNGGTGPTRRLMANAGSGQKISYGIYQNAGFGQAWGSTAGADMIAGTATGLTQIYNAYGQIPVQATPAGGSYADTVVITLSY
jgi:spore coat protein U-like protein